MRDPFTNDDDMLNMTISKALTQADDTLTYLEIEMEQTEDLAPAAKKLATKKVKGTPKVEKAPKAAKPAAKAEPTSREIPDGYIGLSGLAEELDIQPAALRRKLRAMEAVKPEGSFGWRWKIGSKELNTLKKSLTA